MAWLHPFPLQSSEKPKERKGAPPIQGMPVIQDQ